MRFAYIGSYTTKERGGLGKGGITVFSQEGKKSEWKQIQQHEIMNPSYLCFGKNKTVLYSAQSDGRMVTAFSIDASTGKLSFLDEINIGFNNGVSLEVNSDSSYLLVSCAGKEPGGMVVIKLDEDGSFNSISWIEIPTGILGPNRNAQTGTKPHQVKFDLDNEFLIEVEKGFDEVNSYKLTEGKLTKCFTTKLRPGSCPRHIAFHQNGFAYVLTEWFGEVVSCTYSNGEFKPFSVRPTIPFDFVGLKNSAAEIEVHPNGELLYISNREHNSIVGFRIYTDGSLECLGWTYEDINKPRFFKLSEDGEELFCANEKNHTVSVFEINQMTGKLQSKGIVMHVEAPACLLLK